MIPSSAINFNTDNEILPSLTYKLDTVAGRITGMIDKREALIQTIYKILNTERYAYLIYNWFFGVEILPMFGQDFEFAEANMEKTLNSALTQDDRIQRIENLQVSKVDTNSLYVIFNVITSEGVLPIEQRYNYGS